jgi:RNA-binding protein
VLKEIDSSLNAHELIKIKVLGDDRALRVSLLEQICQQMGAVAVHHIGKQLVVYRASSTPKIVIPKQ